MLSVGAQLAERRPSRLANLISAGSSSASLNWVSVASWALTGATARIRYFRAPVKEPYVERESDLLQVAVAEIRAHTRVYFHDGRRWRIGRIEGEHHRTDEQYVVALPNREGEILSSDQFDIRWAPRIEDPYEILASLGGNSPLVYEPRAELIASWHALRAAAAGVDGLLLGSVELHDHQLTVVRSVSDDHERRYLLADEVGLGKTVEAGALVWQSLRDQPSRRSACAGSRPPPSTVGRRVGRQVPCRSLPGKPRFESVPTRNRRRGPTGLWAFSWSTKPTTSPRAGTVTDGDAMVRVTGLAHGARACPPPLGDAGPNERGGLP